METAHAVGDGKLDNDEMGLLFRRITEIAKRIDAGSVTKKEAFDALQAIVEGKAAKMLTPCNQRHQSSQRKFDRPSLEKRKTSLAPVELRLRHSVGRLGLYDKMRQQYPSKSYPDLHPEDIMAQMWEAENIPDIMFNHGGVPVGAILGEVEPSDHNKMIVASTLQWLGTNVGSCFLSRFLAATDLSVKTVEIEERLSSNSTAFSYNYLEL